MTNQRFVIRQASAQDAASLSHLRDVMFRELGRQTDRGGIEFRDESVRAFTQAITDGTCEAWVAETEAGDAIGSVAMLLYPRLPSPESPATREGYLLNVYTAPAWRGRGVSAALVAASIARAKELGLGRIRLHATEAGQRVYAKAGFRQRVDEMELVLPGA